MTNTLNPSVNNFVDPGFEQLAKIVYEESGLVLLAEKATMVSSRLRHRLKSLNIHNLNDYCDFVLSNEGKIEKKLMISALTTNVSSFFREPHHFELLRDQLAPNMQKELKKGNPVRVWSAGCSTGQEPYSIAMTLAALDPIFQSGDFRILATDIDPEVIQTAKHGKYDTSKLHDVEPEFLSKYLIKDADQTQNSFMFSQDIKNMITFKELNLIQPWPMRRQFDAIFCRNVVIYFDTITQDALWPRFKTMLKSNGTMFVGHSERIPNQYFESVGATAYTLKKNDLQDERSLHNKEFTHGA